MRIPPGLVASSLLASSLALIACTQSSAPVTMNCSTPCAAGTHCVPPGSCVADPVVDMAIVIDLAHDLTMTCSPACAAGTYCNAAYHCVPCLEDAHCPKGMVCHTLGAGSICVAGCASDDRCATNDGGLASACCSGLCLDTQSDPRNCGGCGQLCATQHASSICAAGRCRMGTCDPGWSDCNGDPTDGCETSTRIDPKNCGKCGTVCAIQNGVAACGDGCYLAACVFGFDDCNQDSTDGCEVSVLADQNNCGMCGKSCNPTPHGKANCSLGQCHISACDAGYLDCNLNGIDGCETSIVADPKNCGACGNQCPLGLVCRGSQCTCPNCNIPNASSKCVNNVCTFDKCNPGFGDCDGNIQNGCEADLSSDVANCNGCGKVCPKGNLCINSTCLDKFAFQLTQTIDGQTVTCSAVSATNLYTECDNLNQNGLYFPNGIQCGPLWQKLNSRYSDTDGFCFSLTGNSAGEYYYTCNNSQTRTTWKAHVWGTTMDNGYTQHVRCYY